MHFKPFAASFIILLPISVVADYRTEETRSTTTAAIACNVTGTNGRPTCSTTSSVTNVEQSETWLVAGNPINVLTGNKFESANDIQSTTSE
ncbi:hypothetical protein, partial [Psychrobacter sp. K31L]|uniref:hypothetical protein n=1 Tax=Psychrobacter sp. K31L TaxID=2820758 RepID=UPI001B331379